MYPCVRQKPVSRMNRGFRAFPFYRSFSRRLDCCCSVGACPLWVGRLPYCHLLVDAYLPAFGHTLLPGANSRSPTPTISFLNRTSNFQSSSCFIKRAWEGELRDAPASIEQERCHKGSTHHIVVRPEKITISNAYPHSSGLFRTVSCAHHNMEGGLLFV